MAYIGEILGAVVSAIAIGGVMYLLDAAWGFGSTQLPAPQAALMKLVVEGVMGGSLPWGLVFAGVFVAVMIEILGLPVLPIAIGLYLPIHLSAPIFVGGLIRAFVDKRRGKEAADHGVLFSSGLIAGEGIIGILLALFAIIKINGTSLGDIINLGAPLGNIGGVIFFVIICAFIVYFAKAAKERKN